MHTILVVLSLLALSPSLLLASPLSPPNGPLASRQQTGLVGQSGIPNDIPVDCTLDCGIARSGFISGTCPPESCCTSSFMQSYFGCFQCIHVVTDSPVSTLADPQQRVDALHSSCLANGFTQIPRITFSGQDPDRPTSDSTISATSSLASATSTLQSSSPSPTPVSDPQTHNLDPTTTATNLATRRIPTTFGTQAHWTMFFTELGLIAAVFYVFVGY